MENADSIFIFLNSIGAVLGPVAGVMIARYFFIRKQTICLDDLYIDRKKDNTKNIYRGLNRQAYTATILALLISFSGQFIPVLQAVSNVSWLVGFSCAFIIYVGLKKLGSEDNTEEAVN